MRYFNIQELTQLEQMDLSYMNRIIRLTYLASDIVESILAGLQPHDLTLKDLICNTIPMDWNEQRKTFGKLKRYFTASLYFKVKNFS